MRILSIIALLLPCALIAQVPTATLDTGIMRIGEQVTLILALDIDQAELAAGVQWPVIADTLGGKIEVIGTGAIDTLQNGPAPDRLQLVQLVKITSFDTGFWAIPPFIFSINGQQMETAPILLEVRGIDLGENPELRDIKDIHEVPFNMISWLRRNWYWFAGALVIAGIIWLLIRWSKNRPKRELEIKPEPVLPLHERIIGELHSLERERLWQNGAHKEYHSRLTDLLRAYIEDRFKVPALESTTDELLHELRVSSLSRDQLMQLRNMLELSDMVKFAKAIPSPGENEQMMQGAIAFVKATANHEQVPAHA